jgi:hypothetical protein
MWFRYCMRVVHRFAGADLAGCAGADEHLAGAASPRRRGQPRIEENVVADTVAQTAGVLRGVEGSGGVAPVVVARIQRRCVPVGDGFLGVIVQVVVAEDGGCGNRRKIGEVEMDALPAGVMDFAVLDVGHGWCSVLDQSPADHQAGHQVVRRDLAAVADLAVTQRQGAARSLGLRCRPTSPLSAVAPMKTDRFLCGCANCVQGGLVGHLQPRRTS